MIYGRKNSPSERIRQTPLRHQVTGKACKHWSTSELSSATLSGRGIVHVMDKMVLTDITDHYLLDSLVGR